MSCKLDALVAEKVMGWPRRPESGWPPIPSFDDRFGRVDLCVRNIEDSTVTRPWSPSTDIAAAWEVFDKIRDTPGNLVQITACSSNEEAYPFICEVSRLCDVPMDTAAKFRGQAKTASMAICLAALQSLGLSEEQIREAMK